MCFRLCFYQTAEEGETHSDISEAETWGCVAKTLYKQRRHVERKSSALWELKMKRKERGAVRNRMRREGGHSGDGLLSLYRFNLRSHAGCSSTCRMNYKTQLITFNNVDGPFKGYSTSFVHVVQFPRPKGLSLDILLTESLKTGCVGGV